VGKLPVFTENPRETVWKIETDPILKAHERADRNQQALFSPLVLPETTFNKPSSYFPDSLRRVLLGNSDNQRAKKGPRLQCRSFGLSAV
jgi:hypothetical protein